MIDKHVENVRGYVRLGVIFVDFELVSPFSEQIKIQRGSEHIFDVLNYTLKILTSCFITKKVPSLPLQCSFTTRQ